MGSNLSDLRSFRKLCSTLPSRFAQAMRPANGKTLVSVSFLFRRGKYILYTTYAQGSTIMTDASSGWRCRTGRARSGRTSPTLNYVTCTTSRCQCIRPCGPVVSGLLHGLLWLLRMQLNIGNPYNTSHTQIGFGTFGGPHITSLLANLRIRAAAAWFPEVLGASRAATGRRMAAWPLIQRQPPPAIPCIPMS